MIGGGTFGLIRKVRRKSDGQLFARKELNFERMSERDRKHIVSEVNILRTLQHENVVRYEERFVDTENGILYIVMELCSGGDLGTVIKRCRRTRYVNPHPANKQHPSSRGHCVGVLCTDDCGARGVPLPRAAQHSRGHNAGHRPRHLAS